MFRAIGRLFRTFLYLITGRIDRIRSVWGTNPDVINATYDSIVEKKVGRLNTYKSAVAGKIAQEEKKKISLKVLTEEIVKLENLKKGALAKAQKAVEKYNGDAEAAHKDVEYQKCQQAFKDFSSTLEEKKKRAAEYEVDISALTKDIAVHQTQIQSLLRELEKIKGEKYDTIADVVSKQEEKEIADMFSGVSEDNTAKELQEMRDLRTKARAEARASRELAGLDASKAEEDFLAYATETAATDEFDQLLNLTKKEAAAPAVSEPAKISEN